jgi:LysR family transcriptional regulator, cyn operon transcriptional activator
MSNRMIRWNPFSPDIMVGAMDLRQLEMLIAVAENSSFTRAGQQLHVSQSAISRKICLLEEELGERVFARVNKKVCVTPAGETLLRYARKIFQDLRNASLEISEITHLERGHMKIGAGMIACMYLLPPVLEKFNLLYPKIDLEVITGVTDALIPKLLNNSIELGVFTLPVQLPDLEVIPFCTEEMVVVTSKKHPGLSKKKSIKAAEIEAHPLILFPAGARTRKVLDDFFKKAGISPHISMEAENIATIKPLVKIDLGITIIPYPAVVEETKRQELHCLRIIDHKVLRQIGLVYHKSDHLPRALSELIRLFRENQSS